MKLKYLFLTLFAAAGIAFTACEEKEQDISRPDCRFSKDTLKFDSRADFTTVKLLANRDWVITCDSSFVGIDRIAGTGSGEWQYVDISVTRNNGYNRTATVYATAGRGLSKDIIVISQRGPKGNEEDALLISVSEFIQKADTQKDWIIEGAISGINTQYKYFWIKEGTAEVEVYQPLNFDAFKDQLVEGGIARVKGRYKLYTASSGKQTHEMDKGTILKFTAPSTPDPGNNIFSETFKTSLGGFTREVKSGNVTDVWTFDATYKCAKATSYVQLAGESGKTDHPTEAWLISPEIDLTGQAAATLLFDHASRYFNSVSTDITLWISSDGGAYKQLKIPTYPANGTSFTFVSSGNISLKDFLGHKVKIALVYTATTKSGTYELNNFVVNKEDTGATQYISATVCESLAQAAALGDNDLFEYNKGALVVGRSSGGLVITDGTTTLYAYGETTATIGDKVNLKGSKTTYRGLPELNFAKDDLSIASSNNPVTYPTVKDITSGFNAYTATTYEYVSFTGVLTTSTNTAGTTTYYNITVAGSAAKGSIQQPLATLNVDSFKDKQVTVTGYFAGSNTTTAGEKLHNIILTAIEQSNAPLLTVSSTQIEVKATDTQATFNVGGNVDWTATCAAAGVTVSPAAGNGAGTVTVTFPENADTENAKSYTVVVSTTAAANPNSFNVVINQKKAGGSGGGATATYTLTFSAATNSAEISNYTTTWSATCDGFTWDIANFNNNKNAWAFVKCGRKSDPSVAYIATKTAIPEAIEKVVITFDSYKAATVNSAKLYVDADATFATAACQTVTINGAAGNVTVEVPTPTENSFYKIEFDCKADGSANGPIVISKVVYTNE